MRSILSIRSIASCLILVLVMLPCGAGVLNRCPRAYTAGTPADGDAYTVLYVRADAEPWTDTSATPHSLTEVGTVTLDTTNKQAGAGSMSFNGSGNYLKTADTTSTDWDWGTGDWTVEFYVRWDSGGLTAYADLLKQGDYTGTSDRFAGFSYYAPYLRISVHDGSWYNVDAEWYPSEETWYKVAWARNGNTMRVYVDDVCIAEIDVTGSTFNLLENSTNFGFIIGPKGATGTPVFQLDEIHIAKGIARYTAGP